MKFPVILFVSAALASGVALANDPVPDGKKSESGSTFAKLDSNGDGKLSKDEVSASEHLSKNFTMLDRDSDGFVSEAEFKRNTMKRRKEGY